MFRLLKITTFTFVIIISPIYIGFKWKQSDFKQNCNAISSSEKLMVDEVFYFLYYQLFWWEVDKENRNKKQGIRRRKKKCKD